MIFFNILVAVWLVSCAYWFIRRHYIFFLFSLVFGLYELSALAFFHMPQFEGTSTAQRIFTRLATPENVHSFMVVLGVFLAGLNISYGLAVTCLGRRIRVGTGREQGHSRNVPIGRFSFLLIFLFGIGLLSIATGAGKARALDYFADYQFGSDVTINSSIFYGRALLVFGIGVVAASAAYRKKAYLLFALVCCAPIAYDLFLSGRRQSFAPSALLLLLILLYNRKVPQKAVLVFGAITMFVTLSSVQFAQRGDDFIEVYGLYGINLIVRPVLGELVAIGSTSFYAYNIIGPSDITYGGHLLVGILNSIPYLHLGDLLVQALHISLWSDYDTVAPFGGFSMLADAFLAFHSAGYVVLSVLVALMLFVLHKYFRLYFENEFRLTYKGLLLGGIGAMFVTQYRNGLSDSIRSLISSSILYAFCLFVPALYRAIRRYLSSTGDLHSMVAGD